MERPATGTRVGKRKAANRSVSTSTRLLLAAERLIAQDGVAQVSMRRINAEAGTGNISAVHYHYGSLERVIAAIFDLRVPAIDARRNEMLDELHARQSPPKAHDILQAVIWPLAEHMLGQPTDNCYVRFVAAINRAPKYDMWNVVSHRHRRGLTRSYVLLRRTLSTIPKDVLHARIMLAWREVIYTLADVELMIQARHPNLRDPLVMFHTTDLVTRIGCSLGAPVSEATQVARRILLSKSASEKGTLFGMDSVWAFGSRHLPSL